MVPGRERVPLRKGVPGQFLFRIPGWFLAGATGGRRALVLCGNCGRDLVLARVRVKEMMWPVRWFPVLMLAGVVPLGR